MNEKSICFSPATFVLLATCVEDFVHVMEENHEPARKSAPLLGVAVHFKSIGMKKDIILPLLDRESPRKAS
mgnify:CR=1 FL=1